MKLCCQATPQSKVPLHSGPLQVKLTQLQSNISRVRNGFLQSKDSILPAKMESLSVILIMAVFSHTLGSPLVVLDHVNTEPEVWFEDIDGQRLSDEDLVELPDQDVTTLFDEEAGGRQGRSLANGRISQQLLDTLKKNGTLTEQGKDGLTCIKKMMTIEYTDYTEAMTCVHKTKERCHDTFVTQFEPHQEQVCDEKFEKTCTIYYENVAVNEEVEVRKFTVYLTLLNFNFILNTQLYST